MGDFTYDPRRRALDFDSGGHAGCIVKVRDDFLAFSDWEDDIFRLSRQDVDRLIRHLRSWIETGSLEIKE